MFLLGVVLWAASRLTGAPLHAMDKPNIVFIYTDDQAPWALGRVGNPQIHTPHLDRLFDQGVTFTNSFVTTPVCSPSRAALMASRYGLELGIQDWINPQKEPEIGMDPDAITWPEVLQEAGYETCLVGKWHLGTAPRFHPNKTGFDFFRGFLAGGIKTENPVLNINGATHEFHGLTEDILTDLAIEFLKKDHARKPFLLCLHYRSPHAPWLPVAEDDAAPYRGMDPIIPNPDYPDLDVERVKQKMLEYMASVSGVDRNVGRLLAGLDETGATPNTLVVFTSDHGYNMGHNGIWHKGNGHWITNWAEEHHPQDPLIQRPNLYDNSLRVPTCLRWPGVAAPGSVVERTVTNLDWYPTLLAAAGLELPPNEVVRGRNLLPLVKGESPEWEDDLFCQYSQKHYIETHLRCYRTPEWKLVRDFLREGKDELYNLREDPAENRNLIEDPNLEEIRKDLNQKLLARMEAVGDKVFLGKE